MASFGDFTVARLGMMASQTALTVTGQNIANINTQGYTRQRLDQYSFITNGSGMYRSGNTFTVGSGVMMSGVSQLRDPFLDIRYRQEMASVGWAGGLLDGFDGIESILNDVGLDTGLKTALQGLEDAFKDYNAEKIGEQEFDTLVRAAADQLCTLLNKSSSKLAEEMKNKLDDYKNNVEDVNSILKNIQTLSYQIRKAEINGDSVLELRDQRNMAIDQLSEYMKIDVTYSKEDIGAGFTVEKLTIKAVDQSTGKPGKTLIDGSSCTTVGIDEENGYKLTLTELIDMAGKEATNTPFQLLIGGVQVEGAAKDNQTLKFKTKDGQERTISFTIAGYGTDDTPEAIAAARKQTYQNIVGELQKIDSVNAAFDFSVIGDSGINIVSKEPGANADSITFVEGSQIFKTQNRTEAVVSNEGTIEDGQGYGYLESQRQIITSDGEFSMKETPGVRGIPYYQKALDALANKLATEMNRINTTKPDGTKFDEDKTKTGDLFIARGDDSKNPTTTITAANISLTKGWLNGSVQIVASDDASTTKNDNINRFENLFQQEFAYTPIEVARPINTGYQASFTTPNNHTLPPQLTAKITYLDELNRPKTLEVTFSTVGVNGTTPLSVSEALEAELNGPNYAEFSGKFDISVNVDGSLLIKDKVAGTEPGDTNPNDQCAIVTGITITGDDSIKVQNSFYAQDADGNRTELEGSAYFNGALESYHTNMLATLGADKNTISKIYDGYAISADTINTSRDSVSSVDLNEESINLLQYQKSFAAACRMMTALDELMDRVINNMGIVGR